MLIDIRKTEEESRWLHRCAWAVLVAGLLLSGVSWWHASATLQKDADTAFAQQTADVTEHLDQVADHYVDVLRSFQGMFLVGDKVARKPFHQHFQNLDVAREYPAFQAIQYAEWVEHADKQAFLAAARNDRSMDAAGYPDYNITPQGDRAGYLPVLFNEPMAPNKAALGQDLVSDPARREVMERARDTGLAQVSAPLQQQGSDMESGIVIRLPVYQPGLPVDTTENRRKAFVGMISGVVRTPELMKQAAQLKDWQHLHWTVNDVGSELDPEEAPAQLLFDSAMHMRQGYRSQPRHEAADVRLAKLDLGGRHWQLRFVREPVHAMVQAYPLALLLCGIFASVGLWWAIRSAGVRQSQAASMALDLSQQARDSERRLRSVLDNTVDGIVTLSTAGDILTVNHAVCLMFGHEESDMVRQHVSKLLPATATHAPDKRMDSFLQSQQVGIDGVGRRTEGLRANGLTFPVDMAVSSMELNGQKQYIAVLRDLTAQESAERAIFEAQRQLNEVDEMRRVIVHNAPYAIFVLNAQGVIQTVNPAGEKLVGTKAHELVGRCTTRRFFDSDQVAERARMLALRLNEPVRELDVLTHLAHESPGLPSEWTMRRDDGSFLIAEITVTELRNEFGQLSGYLAMAYDVTSRRDAEYQLQHMAQHDALTSLPNRNMLQEQLKTCMGIADRQGHHMAMMFLDVDRFKKINDGLGHHVGDSVLIEIARRLRAAMRTSDIVARLGGDEFVILLPQISAVEDGERVAQKVLDLFADPLRIGSHELRVTPSIGLAIYPDHGADTITLMRHADLAMYQAKSDGRNRVQVYSDKMQSPSADTLVLENDLYKALERDELRLHFQPQFDCATGRISGAEALLRWEHGGKLIPPSDFIPMAEETGLIVAMGEWVLRRACVMAQQWRERSGWPLRVAVNLSAVQLDQADIPALVAQVLKETRLPPTALELEITESVVVRESLRAADILTQLRAVGVSIAIDDFGVGYSSFAYLRELPVDRLKLDRSFLSSVPESPGDSRLVAALIAMGHRLEVGIVAEGVETHEQAAFLVAHGCDEAQGYYLGRPMKEESFEALLMEHSREQSAKAVSETRATGEPAPTARPPEVQDPTVTA
ncbi:MAG TPA: EAL domain-containing protein [Aquabacterium sp.]|uniref:bifunctional diguanylate cyclase/phosphodiesterase n=1 Tax=Aquabacterium sp. TaxID=1872578 RepID=UPI002E2F16F0|nr:EAL domain-containing protein [Aquabacterium sp.]HEX5357351.1 EAL domain-containing protein [Aquabacterium sp.]